MTPWTPLHPKSVDVVGIHPQLSDLLVVRMVLSDRPPTAWRKALTARCMVPALAVDDEGITFNAADAVMEQTIEDVGDAIRYANTDYAAGQPGNRAPSNPAMPPFSAMVELQETASPDTIARIIAARRRAAGLSGVFQSALWIVEAEAADVSTKR